MTKSFLLFSFALIISVLSLQGQTCIPNNMLPDSIPVDPLPFTEDNPMGGITDTACAMTYYETVFQINLPDTLETSLGSAQIRGASIPTSNGIIDLPASMEYVCNPPSCQFTPDTVGCLIVFGTPTAEEVGVHDLKISVTIDLGFPFMTTLPNAAIAPGNYFLNIQEQGSPNCFMVDTDDIVEGGFAMKIQPNPLSDRAIINVDLPNRDLYSLRVFNATGALVQQRSFDLPAGQHNIEFDGSNLPVGFYTYVLSGQDEAASGRMLIQR